MKAQRMRSEEIHYAIDECRKVVSVLDLNPALHRGLRCRCVCAYCNARLVARLGDERRWHFAHALVQRNVATALKQACTLRLSR